MVAWRSADDLPFRSAVGLKANRGAWVLRESLAQRGNPSRRGLRRGGAQVGGRPHRSLGPARAGLPEVRRGRRGQRRASASRDRAASQSQRQEHHPQRDLGLLTRRLRAHRQLLDHPTSAIQDRSVYEDAEVFAQNLYLQRHMAERDYQTYRELYQILTDFLPPPDLVIYLRASIPTLEQRIALRGRDYEMQIQSEYLQRLSALYEAWIVNFKLCPVLAVPADDLDYVAYDSHLDLIVSKINEKLAGKEEVVFEASEVANADGQSA